MLVRRRAVGATIAATLVFSTLTLTNLALFAAASQRERLSLTANSESMLADTATVLGGTEGLGLIDRLQSFLSSTSFQCTTAVQDIGNYTSTLSASGNQDGVSVNEELAPGEGYSRSDNLTILRPFNGSYAGAINLDLTIRWSGASPLNDVTYGKTEVHRLHLPVRLGQMAVFCEDSVRRVQSLLEGTTFASCDNSTLAPPLDALGSALREQASAMGLAFSLVYRTDSSGGCTVSLTAALEQLGVPGPAGEFSVRLVQGERVSVQVEG